MGVLDERFCWAGKIGTKNNAKSLLVYLVSEDVRPEFSTGFNRIINQIGGKSENEVEMEAI